uniref:Uncharacterized protein n=1 Tax=Arsenophonus endosymbiont of Trialeurodes vaporariorum TaxID=235567 RepID=A0A3B0M4N1_9GAMM
MNTKTKCINTSNLVDSFGKIKTEEDYVHAREQLAGIRGYRNDGLSLQERTDELNKVDRLRTTLFHQDKTQPDNRELAQFIDYLRHHDERLVKMIFYLANIENEKHFLPFKELNKQQQQAIIQAINQLKAL